MIEETGIVKEVDGIMAKILIRRRGTCEGCAVRGICEPAGEGMEIEALNPVMAKPGQKVKVSIKPRTYLKGTIFVYGFPLVSFIAGVIIGKNIGEAYFKKISSDIVSAILGFAALIISFLIVKIWSRKAETKIEYKPVITTVISEQ